MAISHGPCNLDFPLPPQALIFRRLCISGLKGSRHFHSSYA
jgi:hypothetical protein